MKRLIIVIISLFTIHSSHAQEISQHQADSLVISLAKFHSDIDRMNIFFSLAEFQILKPGENKIDFDSATTYLNKAADINKSVKSPAAEGKLVLTGALMAKEKGQKEEAKKMVEHAIGILETGTDKTYLGKAYYELSTYYDNNNDSQQVFKRIALVEQAISAYQQAGNLAKKAYSLTMLGDLLHLMVGQEQKAIEVLKSAVVVYDSIKYKKLQEVYALIGETYLNQSNFNQALKYELTALKTAEDCNDTTMVLSQINYIVGRIYRELDNKELAIKYYKNSLETAKRYNEGYAIGLLILNVSTIYNKLNRPKEALEFLSTIPKKYFAQDNATQKALIALAYTGTYLEAKQYNNAKPYCDTLLRLVNSDVFNEGTKTSIYPLIATYYLYTGQYTNAQTYLMKNAAILKGAGDQPVLVAADARLWYKLDSARGNFKSAFNYLLVHKTITDSLFNETKLRQLQQLGVEYETAKKEDSIKLKTEDIVLLTQKNNLQQANLKQAGLIKNITIAGIILACIIIGLLYRQYRHKHQSNKVISHKNGLLQHLVTEKEWLLKEIHHRVKNNFQTVMGLLGTQAGYQKNDVAVNAITDSQRRIQSMSLIHQRLYQSNNLSAINMPDYVHELVDSLSDSFNTSNHIRFNLEIEPIELDLAHSIPLGLILNEAITNTFKYAFPDNAAGIISVSLKHNSVTQLLLTIKDNGTGLPASFNINKTDSMGMNLMRGLSEEIGAQFKIDSQNGTEITVSFEYEPDVTTGISQINIQQAHLKTI